MKNKIRATKIAFFIIGGLSNYFFNERGFIFAFFEGVVIFVLTAFALDYLYGEDYE